MPNTLEKEVWEMLLDRIKNGKCTPFLGAGASFPALPLGSEIAREWAHEYGYPLDNPSNLVEVAQYLAVQRDPLFPKEKILEKIKGVAAPDFKADDEPHGILSELPIPVYLTTNYDDFMFRALTSRFKDPRRSLCRWNESIQNDSSVFDTGWRPNVANPVVFHLHGHTTPESLVLTEDDYLDFLANIARNPRLLPDPIQQALDRSTCLFIGYRLADWNFRVLFQGLRPRPGYTNVAVLKPPDDPKTAEKQREYLERYYKKMDLRVYWGTAREFSLDLRKRWNNLP